jgi:hypothetical protein
MNDWQDQQSRVIFALVDLNMSMLEDIQLESRISYWDVNLMIAILNEIILEERLNDMTTRIMTIFFHVRDDDSNTSINFHFFARQIYEFHHDLTQKLHINESACERSKRWRKSDSSDWSRKHDV